MSTSPPAGVRESVRVPDRAPLLSTGRFLFGTAYFPEYRQPGSAAVRSVAQHGASTSSRTAYGCLPPTRTRTCAPGPR